MSIDVFITEKGTIRGLHVPEFARKIGQLTNKELKLRKANEDAVIERSEDDKGMTTVHVSYTPEAGEPGKADKAWIRAAV